MQRDEALRILSAHKAELRDKFGVKSVAIFGSTARDEAGPDGDVDVLVEFDRRIGLFHLARTQMFLEEVLAEKIDLVPRNSIFPQLRDIILGEAVDVQ